MMTNPKIVCYGEILWDIFPDKKMIGGAPLNVALRLQNQGHDVAIISKIGNDENGKNVEKFLQKENFNTAGIQKDNRLKTGEVIVSLNNKGTATYEIKQAVAWDEIAFTGQAKILVENSEIFIFGSLASRGVASKETLLKLLAVSKFSIFDVNLRFPFYSIDLILLLMKHSHFVKMNDEELEKIALNLNCPHSALENAAQWLMDNMNLEGICITKGEKGAFLLDKNNSYSHNGFVVSVKDTVGAGDSFLATLIGEMFINRVAPKNALPRACAVGSLVASKSGANCKVTEEEINTLLLETKN